MPACRGDGRMKRKRQCLDMKHLQQAHCAQDVGEGSDREPDSEAGEMGSWKPYRWGAGSVTFVSE